VSFARAIATTRWRMAGHLWRTAWHRHSRFQMAVVGLGVGAMLGGVYWASWEGLTLVHRVPFIGPLIIERLVYLLTLVVFCLLVMSQALVSLSACLRSPESGALVATPSPPASVFLCKTSEATVVAGWATAVLLVPVLCAYARVAGWSLSSLVTATALVLPYLAIAGAVGAVGMLSVVRAVPRQRTLVMWGLAAAALRGVYLLGRPLWEGRTSTGTLTQFLHELLPSAGWAMSPWWPSQWLAQAWLSLTHHRPGEALFHAGLLVANALFAGWLVWVVGHYLFRGTYLVFQDHAGPVTWWSRRLARVARGCWRVVDGLLAWVPQPARALVLKDLRLFWREPLQWGQGLIFFGILGLYFANMQRMGYDLAFAPGWKQLVTGLNVMATLLTLGSLVVRFAYPQMSLELRCAWLWGATPVSTRRMLLTKFWVHGSLACAVTEGLVVLSNQALGLPAAMQACAVVMVGWASFALAALALGLGACFPDVRESDPAKLVSSFGGTLALVVTLAYVGVMTACVVVPWYGLAAPRLLTAQAGLSMGGEPWLVAGWAAPAAAVGVAGVASLAVGGVPLWVGARRLTQGDVR